MERIIEVWREKVEYVIGLWKGLEFRGDVWSIVGWIGVWRDGLECRKMDWSVERWIGV